MLDERLLGERIRAVLRPYASNWSGSLGRGDLVIPHAELSRLIAGIVEAVRDAADAESPASDLDLFAALTETRRLPSVQDQAARLRERYRILKRRG